MHCVSRGTLCALLVLLLSPSAAEAVDLQASGSVVVRWQSDADTCASYGLCGRSGVLSWNPTGNPATLDFEDRSFFSLDVFGTRATVWSDRTVGDSRATCIDRPPNDPIIVGSPTPGGKVSLSLRENPSLNFGRCAGPRAGDFQKAMPVSQPVSRASLRRRPRIDFHSRADFQQGPFSGSVISTLVFTRARSQSGSVSISSGGNALTPARGRRVRYGRVLASYAIERVAADAGYAFHGPAGDACAPFDTCDMNGDISMQAAITGGSLQFASVRRLGPAQRETLTSGLRALRAGRTRLTADATLGSVPTSPDAGPHLPIAESVTPGSGDTCTDSTSLGDPYLYATRATGGVKVRLENSGNTYPDPLRTHCPGPGLDDLGLSGAFATGTLPARDFGARAIQLRLNPAPAFSTLGIVGTGHGNVTLSLRLRSLEASTRTERVGTGVGP